MDLDRDTFSEILSNMTYDRISWDTAKTDGELKLNRSMILKTYNITNYFTYVERQIAFEEFIDLPNVILDKIIDKLKVKPNFSRFLLLSKTRLARYGDDLDWTEVSRNKSLLPSLVRLHKEKIVWFPYYEIIDLTEEKFLNIVKLANEDLNKNIVIRKETIGQGFGSRIITRKEITSYKDRYGIFANPQVIPFLKDFKFNLIDTGMVPTDTKDHFATFKQVIKPKVWTNIVDNPALNVMIFNKFYVWMDDNSSRQGFMMECAKNRHLSRAMINRIIKSDTLVKTDFLTRTILENHIQTDWFMEEFGNEGYKEFPETFDKNLCSKFTN